VPLREIGDGPGRASQLQDVQSGVGTIDNVDIPTAVDLDVMSLNRDFAGFPTAFEPGTALVGLVSNCRDLTTPRRSRRGFLAPLARRVGV